MNRFITPATRIRNKALKKILFFDLIQPNFGPTAIRIINGITNGIITILKNGGPTEIFSLINKKRKIG